MNTAMLSVHAGGRHCGLPLREVVEVLRPLPLQPEPGAPAWMLGRTIIRGESAPVIDLSALLKAPRARCRRFVSLRAGTQAIALAVERVDGVATLLEETLLGLPALLPPSELDGIEGLRAGDRELLAMLGSARLLPEGRA